MDTVFTSLLREEGPRLVGLVGGSGSGKTTAAAEIVRSTEVLEFFSDGVLWLSADEGTTNHQQLPPLMQQLVAMAQENIGGLLRGENSSPRPDFDDSADAAAFVKEVFGGSSREGVRGLRCLVVADNVWEGEVIVRLREVGVWVLVTTRDEKLVLGEGGDTVRINRLFEADAQMILTKAAELPAGMLSTAAAKDVIELCDRVALDVAFVGRWGTLRECKDPVAWSQAVGNIRTELRDIDLNQNETVLDRQDSITCGYPPRVGLTVDQVVRSQTPPGVGTKVKDLSSPQSSSNGSDTTKNSAQVNRRKAVLRAGFRELVAGTGDDRVKGLYLALAVMPNGHKFTVKDAAVLMYGNNRPEGSLREEEEAALKVVEILRSWTILTAVGGDNRGYRMHDAHSSFARETIMVCEDIRRSAVERWVAFISSLEAVLSFEPFTLTRLWSAVRCVGGQDWRASRPYEKILSEVDNNDPLCRMCVEAVAKFYNLEEDWERAYLMWRRVLEVERKSPESNALCPLWELVVLAEKMGKTEKAKAWRGVGYKTLTLAMARTLSPLEMKDGSAGVSAMKHLTLHVIRFGPPNGVEAEMMLRQALEIELAKWGPDDARVAALLQRLGVCVRQTGRLKEAERLLRRALEIEKGRLGPDHDSVARTTFELGMCIRLAGRLSASEKLLKRSLQIEENVNRENTNGGVNLAQTLHELGVCIRLSGRHNEAEILFKRALEIREDKLGPDNVSVAHTLHELGACARQDGRKDDAEAFLRRALGIKETAPGGIVGDVSIAHTMFQLGVCVLRTGQRVEEAEGLLRKVIKIEEARLGPDDISVARIVFHLGVCVRQGGRREEAEGILKRAHKALKAKLGPDSDEVARANDMLGTCEPTE